MGVKNQKCPGQCRSEQRWRAAELKGKQRRRGPQGAAGGRLFDRHCLLTLITDWLSWGMELEVREKVEVKWALISPANRRCVGAVRRVTKRPRTPCTARARTAFKVRARCENVKRGDIKYFPTHHYQQTTCLKSCARVRSCVCVSRQMSLFALRRADVQMLGQTACVYSTAPAAAALQTDVKTDAEIAALCLFFYRPPSGVSR